MTERARLTWEQKPEGATFQVTSISGENYPVDSWGRFDLTTQDGKPASIGPLLGLLEDGTVHPDAAGKVLLRHSQIAALDEAGVRQLGLPTVAPLRLKIRGQGILTSPGFRFQHQLVKGDGKPLMGLRRDGAFASFGGREYILLDPLFTLMEGMDTYNEIPPQDMDGRMLQWAELKQFLPEDVLIDDNLRSINIVRADSFTLDLDDNGNFSPLLLHRERQEQTEDETAQGQPVLPPAPQRDFENRFRQLSEARRRYTTSGNWFVVLPEKLHKTLQVVREYQDAPAPERRAFMANPQAVLKEVTGIGDSVFTILPG